MSNGPVYLSSYPHIANSNRENANSAEKYRATTISYRLKKTTIDLMTLSYTVIFSKGMNTNIMVIAMKRDTFISI